MAAAAGAAELLSHSPSSISSFDNVGLCFSGFALALLLSPGSARVGGGVADGSRGGGLHRGCGANMASACEV